MPEEEPAVVLKKAMLLIEEFHVLKSEKTIVNYSTVSELENEMISKWNGTVCESYVQEFIEFQKKQLEDRRTKWMNKNVKEVIFKLDSLTVPQCIQWQTAVSVLPDYLSDADLEDVENLSSEISKRIKLHRINGVVDMFNALSEEEQKDCLQKILERVHIK